MKIEKVNLDKHFEKEFKEIGLGLIGATEGNISLDFENYNSFKSFCNGANWLEDEFFLFNIQSFAECITNKDVMAMHTALLKLRRLSEKILEDRDGSNTKYIVEDNDSFFVKDTASQKIILVKCSEGVCEGSNNKEAIYFVRNKIDIQNSLNNKIFELAYSPDLEDEKEA